jgi:hypothetical protein
LRRRRRRQQGRLLLRLEQGLQGRQRRLRLLLLLKRCKHGSQGIRPVPACHRLRVLLLSRLGGRLPRGGCCIPGARGSLGCSQLKDKLNKLQPGSQWPRCIAAPCLRLADSSGGGAERVQRTASRVPCCLRLLGGRQAARA